MQTTKAFLTSAVILCHISFASAQMSVNPDSSYVTRNAVFYADSLVKCHFYQNWKEYTALYCPSAVRYYGGPEGFKEHITIFYYRNEPKLLEKPEKVKVLSLMNSADEWQCVIEKVRNTWIDDRKAEIVSYLVGQSKDDGETWKFIDLTHNSYPNLGNIFPEIFSNISIPLGKTTLVDDVTAVRQ